MQRWFSEHGWAVQLSLWLLLIAWFFSDSDVINFLKEAAKSPPALSSEEMDMALKLRTQIYQEMEEMDKQYGFATYKKHIYSIMALEKELGKSLDPVFGFTLNQLVSRAINNERSGNLVGEEAVWPGEGGFKEYELHKRKMTGISPEEMTTEESLRFWGGIGRFLLINYLKVIFISSLLYAARFLGISRYETTFKNEFILARKRLILSVIFWWHNGAIFLYPSKITSAILLRQKRLEAELLRYKPLGYILSKSEQITIAEAAQTPIQDFEKIISKIFANQNLNLKKSICFGYLSLLLGLIALPVIYPCDPVCAVQTSYAQDEKQHLARMEIDGNKQSQDRGNTVWLFQPAELTFVCFDLRLGWKKIIFHLKKVFQLIFSWKIEHIPLEFHDFRNKVTKVLFQNLLYR